jgi:bifunctional non-homologous end joining protein LigD
MTYAVLSNAASLVYVANQGCITPHIGLSRIDRIDRPDRLVFDLDPSDGDFAKVRDAAARVRTLMEELDIAPFVMTTGSRGLHVVVALDRTGDFDAAHTFARDCCERLARTFPDRLTVEQRKAKRGDRVFLDYLRNAYGQTAVGAYGVRARPGAPVATPLEWDEVGKGKLRPDRFTIRNVFRRLGQREDPWAGIGRHAVSVAACARRLADLAAAEGVSG